MTVLRTVPVPVAVVCRAGLAGLVLAGLAACATGASSGGPTAAAAAPLPLPSTSAAPLPAGSPSATPTVSPDDGAGPELTLEGGGFGLLADDGTASDLPFGGSADDVRAAVEDAVGPTTDLAVSCPQGARSALQVDGLTVLLDGDGFVGWSDTGAPDRTTTTADGIGVGSRLADLRSAVPDAVLQPAGDGIATFTSAGGLAGTLTGPDPTATVTALSAGQTCPGGLPTPTTDSPTPDPGTADPTP